MDQLPYELRFCHRFNLHKLLGFDIGDDDLKAIARIYGVSEKELHKIDEDLRKEVSESAGTVRRELKYETPQSRSTYLALGDSITSDRTGYAKIIRELWAGNPDRTVIDAGISGDTTSDVTNRFYSDVINFSFDAASIFIGTNDSRGLGDGYGMTNVSAEEYSRHLGYYVRRLKESGAEVIVVTIPPVDNERLSRFFGTEPNWSYSAGQIAKVNKTIRKTAKKEKIHLADLATAIEERGFDPLDEDGLHLNSTGQQLCAQLILSILG